MEMLPMLQADGSASRDLGSLRGVRQKRIEKQGESKMSEKRTATIGCRIEEKIGLPNYSSRCVSHWVELDIEFDEDRKVEQLKSKSENLRRLVQEIVDQAIHGKPEPEKPKPAPKKPEIWIDASDPPAV
jgi:phosphoenolpyruvate synthase/pyruvate phosphate dikinase